MANAKIGKWTPLISGSLILAIAISFYDSQDKASISQSLSPLERGKKIVEVQSSCRGCHQIGSPLRAPILKNLLGSTRTLMTGEKIRVDQVYLKSSLTDPGLHVVTGYGASMPNYGTILSPEQIDEVVQYLSTL